jgi:catechol 2,3-dioxygenase-like lactoylglutathione lyase family enzyme
MSYVALVTNRFDEVTRFYGELLGFPVVDQWDRSNARGRRFDTGGMRLEIIDNRREKNPRELGETADRVHIVVEVDNIDEAREQIKVDAPPVQDTSWGSRLFQLHDPDGISVTYLQ